MAIDLPKANVLQSVLRLSILFQVSDSQLKLTMTQPTVKINLCTGDGNSWEMSSLDAVVLICNLPAQGAKHLPAQGAKHQPAQGAKQAGKFRQDWPYS